MTSKELRKNFLDFFEKNGHRVVPSSSLIPADPSVLFTTAGMQQFKPYYLGASSPYGANVVSSQKCFRTSDIDEVGDISHLTFLEMLGNFSFGGYFKTEAIKLALEFLIEDCQLKIDDFKFTYFRGDKEVPEDIESKKIWLRLGIPENKISGQGREDNFWGPTGLEGPCGPTTEIHIRGTEIWNLVFNEYFMDKNKKLTPLKQKGVDTGMGLERLAMVVQDKESIFETDLFEPIIREIEKESTKPYNLDPKPYRIIADHIKSSVFLISEGILPFNIERGYILRRIFRRAVRYGKLLNLPKNFLIPLAQEVVEIYQDVYPELKSRETDILTIIQNEEEKFERTLEIAISETNSMISRKGDIDGEDAFYLYESFGMPLELVKEIAEERGLKITERILKKRFDDAFKKHQEISRAGAEKKFGGGGEFSPKLHTATHLLHSSLREILGKHVKQMGSDITPQRLRFDFSHFQKITAGEIKKIEDLVNQKIKEDLEIKKTEMSYEEAIKSGALAFFKEKYPERVTVYSIGSFSKEICAGPHVKRTSELGNFKIIKEESAGAGIRRIRAVLL